MIRRKTIGDRHSTVIRLYNGIQTLQQAEEARVFREFGEMFPGFLNGHGLLQLLSFPASTSLDPVDQTRTEWRVPRFGGGFHHSSRF